MCFDYWFDSWCTTYYIQPYYTYSYLFGLRVPLRLEAESFGLIAQDDRITGELSVSLTPFDGSAADYRAAGLPNNLVYGGRELLAVVCHKDCSAGLDADIPGPDVHIEGTVGEIDLLSKIGGKDNFKPPDVDQRERIADRTLDIDLLGGEADFGFVGAKVNPYLRIIMTGRDKSIKVDQTPDDGCSPQGEKLEHNERRNDFGPPPQGIPINLNNNNERVMIKHPAYTFNLQFTVGIEPRTWIDLYLWDHTWSLGRIPIYSPSSPNYRLNRHNGSNCGYPFRVADAAPAREQALQDAIEQRIAEITASVRCDRETRRLELIRQYEQKPLAAFRLCLQKADNLLNLPPEEICPDSSDRYRETQRLYRTVEWRKEWLCQNE